MVHKARFINTQKLRKPVPTSVSKPKLGQCELPKLIWPSGPERKSWNWSVTTWSKLTDRLFRELTETNLLGWTNCPSEKSFKWKAKCGMVSFFWLCWTWYRISVVQFDESVSQFGICVQSSLLYFNLKSKSKTSW